jgi:hypothetical protein
VFGTVTLKNGLAATCTATLIAPNLLVTARHCVSDLESPEIVCGDSAFGATVVPNDYIATNAVVLETSRTWFEAAKIEVPAEGNDTCGFDIALVTLNENVPSSVASPTVPRIDRDVTVGEEYVAVGYGIDERGNTQGRSVLRGLEVVCEPGNCGTGVRVTEFRGTSGVCEGDSGGPALDLDGKVVGVVSRGAPECSRPVYGSISAWREWIQRVALEAAEAGGYEPAFWVTSGVSDPPTNEPEPGAPSEPNPAPTEPGTVAPPAPDLGGQGEPCSSSTDCESGFGCYQQNATSVPFCVERCVSDVDCPGSLSCTDVAAGDSVAGVCLQPRPTRPATGDAGASGTDAPDGSTSEAGCSVTPRRSAGFAGGYAAALAFAAALTLRRRRS